MRNRNCWILLVIVPLVGCTESGALQHIDPPASARLERLLRQRRSEQVVTLCETLLEQRPDDEFVLLKLGQARLQQSDREAARELFARVLDLNPGCRDARYFLRIAEEDSGDAHSDVVVSQNSAPLGVTGERDADSVGSLNLLMAAHGSGSSATAPSEKRGKYSPGRVKKKTLRPTNAAVQQLMQGLAAAERADREARIRAEIERSGRWNKREPMPMEEVPRNVVRADLGMGLMFGLDQLNCNVPTTGRPPGSLLDEEELPRQRFALVGQQIPMCPEPVGFCMPSRTGGVSRFENRSMAPYQLTANFDIGECQDGLDNNGNGPRDAQDPVCWDNPNDPTTYSPDRSEHVSPLNSAANQIGMPLAPVAPSVSSAPTAPVTPVAPVSSAAPSP